MTADEFISRYPRLWHMAECENWELIQKYGLLSTSALLDLFEYSGDERARIEDAFRASSIEISHPKLGSAVIRDQKPMINDDVVSRFLDDLTPSEWYRMLNGRVFFWVAESRLERLLGAGLYRTRPHKVLVLDTEQVFSSYEKAITLSPINSGAIFPAGRTRRGPRTFQRFDSFPWQERLKHQEPVVELAVDHSVPTIGDCLIESSTRQAPPKT